MRIKKRVIWSEERKHFWHLSSGKARRLDRLYYRIQQEQDAGRLASQDSGNRTLSNNVVTQKDYGITKMESSW